MMAGSYETFLKCAVADGRITAHKVRRTFGATLGQKAVYFGFGCLVGFAVAAIVLF